MLGPLLFRWSAAQLWWSPRQSLPGLPWRELRQQVEDRREAVHQVAAVVREPPGEEEVEQIADLAQGLVPVVD